MAFLKFVASVALGGGIGYGLFCIATANHSDLVKHLPPHSSEQQSLFKLSYKPKPENFMNEGKPTNVSRSFKDFDTQNSANNTKT